MRRFPGWTLCLTSLVALAVVAAGCAKKSPEERIADLRASYEAELNGFTLKSQPVEPAADEAAGEEAAAPAPAPAGDEADMTVEELPVTSDVVLDILLKNKSHDTLPGLTLDVSQIDPQKAEKAHYRIWVDASQTVRGSATQITKVLEGVDYEEGDGFSVEVRLNVPAAERGEYKEFAGAS